jgi:hypothetical protein
LQSTERVSTLGAVGDAEDIQQSVFMRAALADTATIVAVLAAEYTALRDEIGRHQEHRNQLFGLALTIMAALIGFAGAASRASKPPSGASVILLLAPLLFVFLGSAYVDRGRRILDVATYLNVWLRSEISDLIDTEVWLWERFKRLHYEKSRHLAQSVAMGFDWLRGMIFVLCGAVSLILYGAPSRSASDGRVIVFCVDVILLVLLAVFVWLFEETRGLPDVVPGAEMPPEDDVTQKATWRKRQMRRVRDSVHGKYPGRTDLPDWTSARPREADDPS